PGGAAHLDGIREQGPQGRARDRALTALGDHRAQHQSGDRAARARRAQPHQRILLPGVAAADRRRRRLGARFEPSARRGPQPDLLSAAMPKQRSRRDNNLRRHLAHQAARLMAVDGVADFAAAKWKAARQAGLADSNLLPDNEEIEEALREYQALYQSEDQ